MDFHALYERYAPHVHRFALFLCGDDVLAEDITSETFVRAWVAQGNIVQETVKAYLFAIARNIYRDSLRRARQHLPLTDSVEPSTNVERGLHAKSELRVVLFAMQRLPEADRAALLMRAQDGMSYEEIAHALQLTVSNVKVKVHRARLRLMEAREGTEPPDSLSRKEP